LLLTDPAILVRGRFHRIIAQVCISFGRPRKRVVEQLADKLQGQPATGVTN
jgi:hypothetical protein